MVSYLEICGYQCALTKGYVGKMEHYWITLPDGRIVDPTSDQFSEDMPEIYIGVKPNHYKVRINRG